MIDNFIFEKTLSKAHNLNDTNDDGGTQTHTVISSKKKKWPIQPKDSFILLTWMIWSSLIVVS